MGRIAASIADARTVRRSRAISFLIALVWLITTACTPNCGTARCEEGRCPAGQACSGFWTTSCETCGAQNQPCCDTAPLCSGASLFCESQFLASSVCHHCGGAEERCCANDRCAGPTLICSGPGGFCRSCGADGQPCCPGDGGTGCNTGSVCGPVNPFGGTRTCAACGHDGQPCCAGAAECAEALVCASPAFSSTRSCRHCGRVSEPCCAPNLSCSATGLACTGPLASATCQPCGAAGQPCCDGVCQTGAACGSDHQCGPTPLFASCSSSATCTAPRAYCDREFVGAICSVSCLKRADCGPVGRCVAGRCLPDCESATRRAACTSRGGACAPVGPDGTLACFPACVDDPARPPGPRCPTDLACDALSGRCLDATSARRGRANGGPCDAHDECASGFCILDSQSMLPSGTCASLSVSRSVGSDAGDASLAVVSCPDRLGPWPSGARATQVSYCLPPCRDDCDCALGSACAFAPPRLDGVCAAADCREFGRVCPAGDACDESMATARCRRAIVADGGLSDVADGSDAATPDAGALDAGGADAEMLPLNMQCAHGSGDGGGEAGMDAGIDAGADPRIDGE